MKRKLLAFDLDGTLLNKAAALSSVTINALNKMRAQGHVIVIATGRCAKDIVHLLPEIKPDAVVCSDGAIAKVAGKTLFELPIPKQHLRTLIQRSNADSDIRSITLNAAAGYISTETPKVSHHSLEALLKITTVTPVCEDMDVEAYVFMVESKAAYNHTDLIKDMPELMILPYENLWIVKHHNARKWFALQAVAQYLNIDEADIIAFGDGDNDIEMIRECKTGIAMENAVPAVKAVANGICGTNNMHGVARWLLKNILSS